ncbi:MAG: protein-L-isoaspartate O-methyltransferase [Candidatus Moranbacteria bacterium]|nr:protein-L-isoaspartate O-methyltransferase [bacterium]MDP1833343.1 protein-L-isoaspartate O-methyltransferase [Candidatus Moranbacteria bacterium]
MSKLVNNLIRDGYLKSDAIIDALEHIRRVEFVPKDLELEVDADVALPIGYGQTISQPLVVAIMLELLDPQKGQKILDVGSGSGWTTALLSYVVGPEGKVIAVDIIDALSKFGRTNADKFGFVEKGIAEFHNADGSKGFPAQAPYDRILVSASANDEIPQALKDQLKIGGKMVIPYRNSIIYLEKESADKFYKEEFPGFTFVPFVIN